VRQRAEALVGSQVGSGLKWMSARRAFVHGNSRDYTSHSDQRPTATGDKAPAGFQPDGRNTGSS